MVFCLNMTEMASADLVAALESNDRGFFGELQTIVSAIIHKWGWPDREDIRDIAQDCFLKLLRNVRSGKFKGESSLKTYIYAIVRNTCIDYYKAHKAVGLADIETVDLADESFSVEEWMINRDQRRLACRVLQSLPDECRRLWRAVFFGKRNYKQAADLLGLAEGTVKRRMWECRQIAREMLKSLENREPLGFQRDQVIVREST